MPNTELLFCEYFTSRTPLLVRLRTIVFYTDLNFRKQIVRQVCFGDTNPNDRILKGLNLVTTSGKSAESHDVAESVTDAWGNPVVT